VHPLLVVAVPLVLIILVMILNRVGLAFDQPPGSPEQDPAKKLPVERENFRNSFDRQKTRALKWQERTGRPSAIHPVIRRHGEQSGSFLAGIAEIVFNRLA